jgi:hypothetical protein
MGWLLKQVGWRNTQLMYIGLLWLLTIAFGLVISFTAFIYPPLAKLSADLGVFWLFLLGIAHALNSIADRSRVYWLTDSIQILAGGFCLVLPALHTMQYLIVELIGGFAIFLLIRFR